MQACRWVGVASTLEGTPMRSLIILIAALFLSSTAGRAQDTPTELRLSPDDERAVYQTLSKKRVKARPAKLNVRVGSRVPRSVSLHPIPRGAPTASVRRYRYTLADQRVVLVEPRTRTVVFIIGVGF
jgi:hypothetical protein